MKLLKRIVMEVDKNRLGGDWFITRNAVVKRKEFQKSVLLQFEEETKWTEASKTDFDQSKGLNT